MRMRRQNFVWLPVGRELAKILIQKLKHFPLFLPPDRFNFWPLKLDENKADCFAAS